MKEQRRNRSVIFRGAVIALALALMVLCLPFNGLVALAQLSEYTDYSYMTIGRTSDEFTTTVVKGGKYFIPNAYIGGYNASGTNFIIGKATDGALASGVTLKSSTVTVSYNTMELDEHTGAVEGSTDITDKVVVTASEGNYGYFKADRVGTYTIKYSYEYETGSKVYENSYELKVESEITNASINFNSSDRNFIPSTIDLSLAKTGTTYKDMRLPKPEIKDDDGETVDATFVTNRSDVQDTGKYVLVSVKGGIKSQDVTVSSDANGLYVAGSVFGDENFGAGKYVVKYDYYENGQFITSTTKTTQVENTYYENGYELKLDLASNWSKSAKTGVETSLPTAVGVTTGDTKPANSSVDVYYTVSVYYKKTASGEGYKLLTSEQIAKYNEEAGETIINADGTLVNPAKFTALEDGWYSFVYDIYDYYYVEGSDTADLHHKRSSIGNYAWEDIKDETNPTPIVYDASEKDTDGKLTYRNVKTDLKSRATANGVIIYAIGIDDNISKNHDEGIELTRQIKTDESVTKFTIDNKYADYNLIFNYRKDSSEAYSNLIENNYLLKKKLAKENKTITSDAEMLTWLIANGYRIVVDNANAEHIASLFASDADSSVITTEQSTRIAELNTAYKNEENSDAKAEKLTARNEYIKGVFENALANGFAYIDTNETFGATSSNNGMGVGTYYIHYIAKDAAGNTDSWSQSMYIQSSVVDTEIPEIKITTNLADAYLPSDTITFDAPTVSDNLDSKMQAKVLYRFLDKDGKVISVSKDEKVVSNNDLTELWADLTTVDARDESGTLLTTKYASYQAEITGTYTTDGYVDITSDNASSYSIKLSEGTDKAVKVQIVTYVYDDAGNPSIYANTINILNVTDNVAPKFKSLNNGEDFETEYEQGAEIEIPSFKVLDDAVEFMDFEIKVLYTNSDKTKTEEISTYGSHSNYRAETNGNGYFTVSGAKFIAPYAGSYRVSIAVKDFKNNTIVTFVNYEVEARTVVQPPVVNSSLESKTIELGETINLPAPSISYDIPNSISYEEFLENGSTATEKFVVRGVDKNGNATRYSIVKPEGSGSTKGSFTPKSTGVYTLYYEVDLEVYNHSMFTYHEVDLANDDEGGYSITGNDSVRINKVGDIFEVKVGNTIYDVVDENGDVKVYNHGNHSVSTTISSINSDILEGLFDNIKVYNLESEKYSITVSDSTAPVINGGNRYDYATILDTDTTEITIYALQASDLSGLDESNCKITVSAKLADSTPGDTIYSGTEAFKNHTFKLHNNNGKVLDGVYTITYRAVDKKGNGTSGDEFVYTISVGDVDEPTLTFDEGFVEESYEIGTQLRLDKTKIHWDDKGRDFPEDTTPTIKLVNTSTNKEIEFEVVGDYYEFEEFTQVGTYKLTIEVTDAVGHKSTHEGFSIEVTEKSTDAVMTYKVIGTILIVISVLILVGVIVYFIVSKVKLDKELKK